MHVRTHNPRNEYVMKGVKLSIAEKRDASVHVNTSPETEQPM
jgi:hypothetical protein